MMNNNLKNGFNFIYEQIKEKKPLIHHLTNYVTAGDCANMALCFGASPIMADAAEEIGEITGSADCLVLNLGTMNPVKFASMELAAVRARKKGIPIVLDPVGVMASNMRLHAALELICGGVSIVRGNYAECRTLLLETRHGKGVDSFETQISDIASLAKSAAKKFGCVFAVTGKEDAVSDGNETIIGNNGVELLTKVTGTGCMTTTLIGCSAAARGDFLQAALCGIQTMNLAAETAASSLQDGEGPGTFKVRLFDAIYTLSCDELIARSKLRMG